MVGVDLVIPRSALGGAVIVVVTATLLLEGTGSEASLLPETVFVTMPDGAVTFTTSVNDAVAAFAIDAVVQVIVPVPPIAGVVQLKPAGEEIDWNVVPDGTSSVILAFAAESGPLFVSVCV